MNPALPLHSDGVVLRKLTFNLPQVGVTPAPDWRTAVFSGFDEGFYAKCQMMAVWASRFLVRMAHNDRSLGTWLAFMGDTGNGKTTLARGIVRAFRSWAIELHWAGYWRTSNAPLVFACNWPDVCKEKDEAFENTMSEIQGSEVVFLDDIGSETDPFKTGEGCERLRRVLSRCERKWLLITTNVPDDGWKARWDERVADRLTQARICDTKGVPSHRGRQSQHGTGEIVAPSWADRSQPKERESGS